MVYTVAVSSSVLVWVSIPKINMPLAVAAPFAGSEGSLMTEPLLSAAKYGMGFKPSKWRVQPHCGKHVRSALRRTSNVLRNGSEWDVDRSPCAGFNRNGQDIRSTRIAWARGGCGRLAIWGFDAVVPEPLVLLPPPQPLSAREIASARETDA